MGYDIELRFGASHPYNKQELIARLAEAGAELNEDEHYAPDPHISYCGYGLFLSENKQAIAEGRWVFGRAPRDEKRLRKFIKFARELGCTLYDPQLKVDIAKSTIHRVIENMEKSDNTRATYFGTIQTKME